MWTAPWLKCIAAGCVILFAAGLPGCGEDPPPSRDDIFNKQMELPTLYLTTQTGQHVIAPASKGVFVDEKSGEVCWPAQACHNPDCPGVGIDGEPHLFIVPLPGGPKPTRQAAPDKVTTDHVNGQGHCPQCLKIRRLDNETPQLRQQYGNFVRPHVLPEAAEQMKEIEAARKARLEAKKKR